MRVRTGLGLMLLATTLAFGACASTGVGGEDPFATLVIHNDVTSVVTIYAIREGGGRLRLGQVSPMNQAEFTIGHHMVSGGSQLQLQVDPMGSRQTRTSAPLHVNQGDVLELRVSAFLR